MVLDADKQTSFLCLLLDFDGLRNVQNERFDTADVLAGAKRVHDDRVVGLVRGGYYGDAARRQFGEGLFVEFRVACVDIAGSVVGQWTEVAVGEGFCQGWGLGKRFDGAAMLGADSDVADAAFALHLVERGEDLIVGDHAAADQEDSCGHAFSR